MIIGEALLRYSREEPRLPILVEFCRRDLQASQVWLFGSRARGDHRPDSDWDILVVIPDEAPEDYLDPIRIWNVRRRSGVLADVIAVRTSDFEAARHAVTTLSHAVHQEGVRLDASPPLSPSPAVPGNSSTHPRGARGGCRPRASAAASAARGSSP